MKSRLSSVLVIVTICIFTHLNAQQIRSVTHKVPPYTDYWKYDKKGVPEGIVSTTKDSSTTLMFYHFTRNKMNLLEAAVVEDVGKNPIYSFSYYYNTANQVIRMEKLADLDYDNKADDIEFEFLFAYDSLGRVADMKIKKSFTISRHFQFIWQKGNIVQVNNTDGELNYIMKMEFDNTPNPLKHIQWEYLSTTGTFEFYATVFCENNLIKATLFPAGMDSTELGIMPKYNDAGLYMSNGMEGVSYHY
jgi:hypothetical protein